MHTFDAQMAEGVLEYVRDRLALIETPLDGIDDVSKLESLLKDLITKDGIGYEAALKLYDQDLSRMVISADSPKYFAFIPAAPTKASLLFDSVISAASLQGISWLEAAGAIAAENQALKFLSDAAGLPSTAGGTFVSGGSSANLAALTVARDTQRTARNLEKRSLVRVAVSDQAHSSIERALSILDIEALVVKTENHRLTGDALERTLNSDPHPENVIAVVATSGTTNAGIIDDLESIAQVAKKHNLWFHIDGAYGAAALLAPSVKPLFKGFEHADSFIIDPHKWLFAPFDSAAIIYRNPNLAKQVHTQHASYLDVLHGADDCNPSDYAHHLTRRARGLAFWFSLITYGTDAYTSAIESSIDLTHQVAREMKKNPNIELINEPQLSIILFKRKDWNETDYQKWAAELLQSQIAFVAPSAWNGEVVGRLVFLHPSTTLEMALAAVPK